MCGITGFYTASSVPDHENRAILARMADRLHHRGPNDSGFWHDDQGIWLGHRRLSILDLSASGHQPMMSHCGRYVLCFNGEIYNHLDLRKQLAPSFSWRGMSDTETLLVGIQQWGLVETLKRCSGMFAIALWDRQDHSLSLARDRVGEKPLYYGWQGQTFLFGSELKALCQHPAMTRQIDRNAITAFLRYAYVPTPYSIYSGVYKLNPGTILTLNAESLRRSQLPDTKPFWSLDQIVHDGQERLFSGSARQATDILDGLLHDAVGKQMISDVPLGAFLSGGIDSSAIVACMQAQSHKPIKTYTIGFHESAYNEAEYAQAIAKHLGTDHTTLYVQPNDALDVIPRLSEIYDEPFADSSQIPTCLVMALAQQHVTVALSGDGADELFGGYDRYFWGQRFSQIHHSVPHWVRIALAHGLRAVPVKMWDTIYSTIKLCPTQSKPSLFGDKIHKASFYLQAQNTNDIYQRLLSHWSQSPEAVVIGTYDTSLDFDPCGALIPQWMLHDQKHYLADDIFVKVDRAAMAVSLETRAPFLDHRLIEFSWTLPEHLKIQDGKGKWLLRQMLYRYIPKNLIDRPKMGFGVPIADWMRGSLRDWAADLLDPGQMASDGIFDANIIQKKWHEHQSGHYNWSSYLWPVLMFQQWHRHQKDLFRP